MHHKGLWIGLGLIVAALMGPATAEAQCDTELENLNAPDLEYMGLDPFGQRFWVGPQSAGTGPGCRNPGGQGLNSA